MSELGLAGLELTADPSVLEIKYAEACDQGRLPLAVVFALILLVLVTTATLTTVV